MRSTAVLILFLFVAFCEGLEENEIEGRGKKKKIALWIYFWDLVIKKIFFVKVFYAFAFWVLLNKAGFFFSWFVSYLKEQKHDHHPHHHHYEEYGHPGPYRRVNQQTSYASYNPYSGPERNVQPY